MGPGDTGQKQDRAAMQQQLRAMRDELSARWPDYGFVLVASHHDDPGAGYIVSDMADTPEILGALGEAVTGIAVAQMLERDGPDAPDQPAPVLN